MAVPTDGAVSVFLLPPLRGANCPLPCYRYRKVAFVLEELGLTYESKFLDFNKNEHKAPEHTQYNPNGRIPTIIDHANGDFVVWESNAILLYLVERYDKEKRLTVTGEKDQATLLQWLFFQASGQGWALFYCSSLDGHAKVTPARTQTLFRTGHLVHEVPFRTGPQRH